MKKTLLFLLGVLIALPAMARDFTYTYEGQTLTYTVISEEDKTCMIASYQDTSGNLIIPAIAKDGDTEYSVKTIGDDAFRNCSGLTSVVIGNSVTSIGISAFENCSGLISVVIGNSVKTIGYAAFHNCSGLTSVTIPNSVTSIGKLAFLKCSGLTSVVIGNSVTSIGECAFFECSGLTSVVIGNSVETIGSAAFADSGLTGELIIPNSVTSIGGSAFDGCYGLTSVEIPNSVETIGYAAFHDCSGLTSVTIPNSVTSIGGYAFADSGLTGELIIPNSVTSIGESAFENCSGLTSVVIGNSVETIGDAAFDGCRGLIKSAYPDHIINNPFTPFQSWREYGTCISYPSEGAIIENGIIYGPNKSIIYFAPLSIKGNFYIPNSVTEIDERTFILCKDMTSVSIPSSIASIGKRAFENCSGLTSVYYGADKPLFVKEVIFDESTYYKATLYMTEAGAKNATKVDPWKNFIYIETYDFSAGIEEIVVDSSDIDYDAPYEVYNLGGVKVGNSTDNLAPGLYIIRQGGKAKKLKI